MTFQKTKNLLRVLAFAGMLVTAYLIYQHYKPSADAFCNISNYISCDIVNKSIYAEILGIPVSILGFAAYSTLFAGTFLKETKNIWMALTIFSGIGLLFSLYLTYVELFLLNAICIFCITQQIIILFIFLLCLKNLKDLSKFSQSVQ